MISRVAISLPSAVFRRLEAARRRRGLSRSAAVQRAIDAWLGSAEHTRRVREYIDGYRRHPEDPGEVAGWEQAEIWGRWEP
jgi:metal-responsive CopG/Arc/MetJ family transcriptional regulator